MVDYFNSYATPKVDTEYFKLYVDVEDSTESWELQGYGVTDWTIEENADIEKETDVLGLVDMQRKRPQPTQSGLKIWIRKNLKFAEVLMEAYKTRDYSALNAMKILQKFEFIDGKTATNCFARLEEGVMVNIVNFSGEADSYLGFEIDVHYSNKTTTGEMTKVDGETIKFTPDSAA